MNFTMNSWKVCILTLLCIASCLFPIAHAQKFVQDPAFNYAMKNLHMIQNMQYKALKPIALLKTLLPDVLRNDGHRIFDKTRACDAAVVELMSKPSALFSFVDALGKPGAGVFNGNLGWYGGYEECLTIPDAHYCAIRDILINSTLPLSLYGICAPTVCSVDDVIALINTTANFINKQSKLPYPIVSLTTGQQNFLQPLPSKCFSRNRTYTTGAIVMIVISSILLVLCFCGTVTEYLLDFRVDVPYTQHVEDDNNDAKIQSTGHKHENNEPMYIRFLLCFSLIKNTKAVLDTKVPSGSITSINGIRTLSITWVIIGHVLLLGTGSDNVVTLLTVWVKRFSFQAISNAVVSVDTFFVLSGLLVGYLSFKRFESHGKLPLVRFYLHRYIRLTVSYAYLIFFVTYLYPYLHHGPNWVDGPDKGCSQYWWTNLLYINNFYPKLQDGCYPVSWYLANDMQFYVISPIILWCMYKWKTTGVLVSGSLLMFEYLLANGLLIKLKDATPLMITDKPFFQDKAVLNYQEYIYQKSYTRIAPYVIGLILGYILFYKKTMPALKSKNLVYLCGWLAAIGVGLAVVYGPYTNINGHQWNFSDRMTYGLFFRIAWALAVSWVIYACHNGYGSIINDFLSWGAFLPLSRLTYGTYLIHWYVISFFYQGLQTPFHITEITVSFLIIAVTVISYMLSFAVAVLIDYPVGNLEKLFLKF